MDLLRFAKTVLPRHKSLHELEVTDIEPQRAIHPNLNDIDQFSVIDAVHTPARARECSKTVLTALALLDECRHTRFAFAVVNNDVDDTFFHHLLSAINLSARDDLFRTALSDSAVEKRVSAHAGEQVEQNFRET